MKETPIFFSDAMVRAILDRKKTQTRRVIKPQPVFGRHWKYGWITDTVIMDIPRVLSPYGIPGDRLWVKETWFAWFREPGTFGRDAPLYTWWDAKRDWRTQGNCMDLMYPADWPNKAWEKRRIAPSIFMPRWASRITLEVTNMRAERVQDISYDDIVAEGWDVKCSQPMTNGTAGEDARAWFRKLWDNINGKRGHEWDKNDWTWAIEFELIEPDTSGGD